MTPAGAALWWDRAEDLRLALKAVEEDPVIGPHMDLSRVGAASFSAGGFTALVAAGARVDRAHFARFCSANPDDGVCRPQRESSFTEQDFAELFKRPEIQAELARATDDQSIKQVRAAFVMAPALVRRCNLPAWNTCTHRSRSCWAISIQQRHPRRMALSQSE
jgi:predicted dienelactone hydrolase